MGVSEAKRWSIAFASREVWPFVEGGGIGRCVWAGSKLLADHADVTVVTSERWRPTYESLVAAGDPRLPANVRFAFAREPEGDLSPFVSWHHKWSARLRQAIVDLFPDGGPDLVEVADYQGEGFALAHAIRGRDPRLRRTRLLLRLSTSAEICAALNEEEPNAEAELARGVERFALRFADALLWPGGNSLEYYQRFYGENGLGPAIRCPLPTTDDMRAPRNPPEPPVDGPLRMLFLNRLERRKGIEELITAVRTLPDADLRLTIVGRDTATGPSRGSMKQHAVALAGGDERIEFGEQVPHAEVPELIAAHHLVVIPSRWETFSYVTREALAANRPVLATPSGGIVDVVVPERSGWLAPSSAAEDLAATLREVVEARTTVHAMIADGLPRAVFEDTQSNDEQRAVYAEIVARAPTAPPASSDARVDAIVSLDGDGTGLAPTVRSLERQHGVELTSVLVLKSDQRPPEPAEIARLTAIVCRAGAAGRPAAWASGLRATSSEAVLLIPAGTALDESFLERALAVLHEEPELGYVTAFAGSGYLPWHAPLGAYAVPLEDLDGGGSVAVFRRSALTDLLAGHGPVPPDEAAMYASLGKRGIVGLVLHEPLVQSLPKRLQAR